MNISGPAAVAKPEMLFYAPGDLTVTDFGTKCPELVDTLTKKQTDFSLKIEMGGKPF